MASETTDSSAVMSVAGASSFSRYMSMCSGMARSRLASAFEEGMVRGVSWLSFF